MAELFVGSNFVSEICKLKPKKPKKPLKPNNLKPFFVLKTSFILPWLKLGLLSG